MKKNIIAYLELMRFHKPVGIFLLLWPTWWALWIAARGLPTVKNFFIFTAGVVIMRAAGCVINDVADHRLDCHVLRTKTRPITSGKISPKNALLLFFILCAMAFILVLFTNPLTLSLAFIALFFATIYPFTKRYTHWPQLILGIAFAFSIPMAFAAETNSLSFITLLLMLTTITWTIVYDTQYAMVDRAEDINIGIRSTAILFGKYDRYLIGLFQLITLGLLCFIGNRLQYSFVYFISLLMGFLLFLYQQFLLRTRQPKNYFRAFLNNQWFGLIVFLGIVMK